MTRVLLLRCGLCGIKPAECRIRHVPGHGFTRFGRRRNADDVNDDCAVETAREKPPIFEPFGLGQVSAQAHA